MKLARTPTIADGTQMIQTVADLLRELLVTELPALDKSPIVHAPSIGAMYEGLSGKILAAAIPAELGVRVVSGFATDGQTMSGQIDRMVVRGTGERVPNTDLYVWPIQDVILAVEVKKTLTQGSLGEAITQLNSIRDVYLRWLAEAAARHPSEATPTPSLALRAFSQMTGRAAPSSPAAQFTSISERLVYGTLYQEQFAPLRAVLGLHGHKTESGFRRALVTTLKTNLGVSGFSPGGLPQLMVSGQFSIVKTNGQPYTAPLLGDEWPVLVSTPINPLLILLEVLWTRLDFLYDLGNPWGDDLQTELPRNLVMATGTEHGWRCRYIDASEAELRQAPLAHDWQPAKVSEVEFLVITMLCGGERIDLDEPDFGDWLADKGTSPAELRDSLLVTRLVALKDSELVLVTVNCRTAILPTGEYVAGEDGTGRLTRWVMRQRRGDLESDR